VPREYLASRTVHRNENKHFLKGTVVYKKYIIYSETNVYFLVYLTMLCQTMASRVSNGNWQNDYEWRRSGKDSVKKSQPVATGIFKAFTGRSRRKRKTCKDSLLLRPRFEWGPPEYEVQVSI